jgi:hypothetical protein
MALLKSMPLHPGEGREPRFDSQKFLEYGDFQKNGSRPSPG